MWGGTIAAGAAPALLVAALSGRAVALQPAPATPAAEPPPRMDVTATRAAQ